MKWWRKIELKKKLILSFLFFGFAPAGIISWISWESTMKSLKGQAEQQLTFVRETKIMELDALFNTMRGQVRTMANSTMVVEAMKAFSKSYYNYAEEFKSKPSVDEMKKSVRSYYESQFGQEYRAKNGGKTPAELESILDRLNPNGLALQYSYISANPNPLGSKHELMGASDGTTWSSTHQKFHPSFKGFLEEFGYYDIFLVEPKDGHIVYTVFKELDFTTSLLNGSYAKTNIGDVFREAKGAAKADYVALTDLKEYFPSYEFPAGFIGAPIMEGNTLLGVLIYQIPVEKINSIMTNQAKWKETGFGDSGEVYLIGSDKKMRSVSRFLSEDREGYLDIAKTFVSKDQLDYISSKGTSALAQPVDSKGARDAISGNTGFDVFPDYRGVPVFSSYRPAGIKGLDWYVLSEIDEAEALQAVELGRIMLAVLAISMLCIGLFAWYFSSQLATVILNIVKRLKLTTFATLKDSTQVNEASQKVSETATEQASSVQEISTTLEELSAMVKKSVEFANESTTSVIRCQEISHEGKTAVDNMTRAMDEINSGNKEIMDEVTASNERMANIVKVINEISDKTNVIHDIVFQTKLLSFNASVEAARAGEHGKGFAVVAEEVGSLARMSGEAAREIKAMLASSVTTVQDIVKHSTDGVKRKIQDGATKVNAGLDLTKRCGEVLDQIVDNIAGVTRMMSDLSAGASEQSSGIENISTAMNQIDHSTNINAETANQTLNSAQKLSDQARILQTIVEDLQAEVMGLEGGADVSIANAGSESLDEDESLDWSARQNVQDLTNKRKSGSRSFSSPQRSFKKVSGNDTVHDDQEDRFEKL